MFEKTMVGSRLVVAVVLVAVWVGMALAQLTQPDLSGVSREERQMIEKACDVDRELRGPAAYYKCLSNQLVALGPSLQRATPEPAPKYRPPRQASKIPKETLVPPPSRRPPPKAETYTKLVWPTWTGIRPPMPSHVSSKDLPPAQIFQSVASSLYVVLAGQSEEHFKLKRDITQGSAVAISQDVLLTNCHVVENKPVIILLQDESADFASVTRADPKTDRCFMKSQKLSLSPVKGIRLYSDLAVGERVYSIGTPSGLERTLGEGLISGLRKQDNIHFIQTSAPVSPGSSGGGLFDARGNLIGITTFLLRETQALNFAIAADEFWH